MSTINHGVCCDAKCILEGIFCCRGRDSGCKPHYTIKKRIRNGNIVVGGLYRAEDGQAECLADQMLAGIFVFESGEPQWGEANFSLLLTTPYVV